MNITIDQLPGRRFRVLWHVIFWLLVLVFYTLFFGQQSRDYLQTLYFAVPLMVITIGTTWFISYFLFPRYLATGRYFLLLVFLVLTFVFSVWLETVTVVLLLIGLIQGGRPMPDHATLNLSFLVVGMYFVILIAVSVKLLKYWFQKQNQLNVIARDKLEAELKLLRSQIHPHFLFNTLNNIYSLALKKSDTAPEMILKLSEILDYLLYQCDTPRVPLEKELTLISNYIALEEIRYADRLDLDFEVDGNPEGVEIAPLILLPFFENSFKHGAGKKRKGVFIRSKLEVSSGALHFAIANNKPAMEEDTGQGGLGLLNIRKRLDLLYPGKHRLEVQNSDDTFNVNLSLDLS